MKRIFTLLFVCLTAVTLQAQSRFSSSFELAAGAGFSGGPVPTVLPEYVLSYDLGSGFAVGAGIGLQLARPLRDLKTVDGVESREYMPEISIPAFLRVGYAEDRLFTRLDAGYGLGLFCFDSGVLPIPDARYKGFFFEPQVGYSLGAGRSVAMGILLHQGSIRILQQFTTGDSFSGSSKTLTVFTPAVTVRYIRAWK